MGEQQVRMCFALRAGRRRRAGAFTLVELLVVIGIIALLIGILVPTLARARQHSQAVRCAGQLRELYVAQTFYSNDNAGRFTPGLLSGTPRSWHALLTRYIAPSHDAQGALRSAELFTCPSVDPQQFGPMASAYGINSCLMLPNWRLRRDRKCNASEIILMGDKPMSNEDILTTEDGFYVNHPREEGGFWIETIMHRSRGTYRHGNGAYANMVMMDGHVATMTRPELVKESGHWYWGKIDLPVYEGVTCTCP